MTKLDSAKISSSKRAHFIEEAPIIISQDDARQGPMGYQVAHVLGFGIAGTIRETHSFSCISLGSIRQAENWTSALCGALAMMVTLTATPCRFCVNRNRTISTDRSDESCDSSHTASDVSEPRNKYCSARSG
jgi:hypothetical protein